MTEKRKYSKKRKEMGEEAWAEYQRQRKIKSSTKYQHINSEKVVNSRRKKKELLVEYKGGKCERCGLISDICDVYDFHHKDPSKKEFGLGKIGKNWSLETSKAEVDKCMLLCRNCHAIVHYEINKQRIIERQNKALEFYNSTNNTNLSLKEFLPNKRT